MKLYLPVSMIIKQNTSHSFLQGCQSWGCSKLGTNPPEEGFSKLKLFLGSSPLIASICLTDIMARLNFLIETTHFYIFNYSFYLALPPTHHPSRQRGSIWYSVSHGTATAQPLGPNSLALLIPTFLLFLILMEKVSISISRDVLI